MQKILLSISFVLFYFFCFAQHKYALLIGINHYQPPPGYVPSTNTGRLDFPNLFGCKNDVNGMYSIIRSKFDFKSEDIDTLFDESATRKGILEAMDKLINKCGPGDIALIYYSGHGSQVKNSLSRTKADKHDQTIVPSDTWKQGVKDIRDKELAKKFNEFITKKIKLTAIFDCCYSGSLSRGPNIQSGINRFMPESDWDSKDSSMLPIPEKMPGDYFLLLTAARADERAEERKMFVDNNLNLYHGVFTYSLMEALKQESSNVSAQSLFIAARAILKNDGLSQEPDIKGMPERLSETLFGENKTNNNDHSNVAVENIDGQKIILEGGWALGICKGNELCRIAGNKIDTILKLRIDSITGVSTSVASVIKGDIKGISPGNLFAVTNWASPDVPLINVYIPHSGYSDQEVNNICLLAAKLKKSHKIIWLENITNADPYTTVFFDQRKCYFKEDKKPVVELKDLTELNILSRCKKDSTLYFEIPASKTTSDLLISTLRNNKNIKVVDNIELANYCLYGKASKQNLPAYGLRKVQVSAADSLESMPLETDCFEIKNNNRQALSENIDEEIRKLSKLRGWLNIISSPQENDNTFHFHLSVYDQDKKLYVSNGYKVADSCVFSISADSDFYHYQTSAKDQYVYVFAIDQSGSIALYFPDAASGNSQNKFPLYAGDSLIADTVIQRHRVDLPTGTDNYFLLATDEPIQQPYAVFQQTGVKTTAVSRSGNKDLLKNPFSKLLDMGNANNADSRSGKLPATIETSWVLKKYSIKCIY